MKKDIPKMYQNKVDKDISSIQKVYSSLDKNNQTRNSITYPNISISKKIDNIFSANDYVYKADVTIVTDNDKINKRIVARDNNNLITITGEYIPISIIRDIYK